MHIDSDCDDGDDVMKEMMRKIFSFFLISDLFGGIWSEVLQFFFVQKAIWQY